MAYSITDQCIDCNRCVSTCPTGAIRKIDQRYEIEPLLCNHCVGYYSVAQCWSACPTNYGCVSGITNGFHSSSVVLAGSQGYWEQWFKTYNRMISRLHGAERSEYWNDWFDGYAQRISRLLQSEHHTVGTEA